MFCNKCGKTIEDGNKFCPYCGAVQRTETFSGKRDGILREMTVLDLVICIIYSLTILWWSFTFFPGLKASWNAFYGMSADAKFLGILLYVLPYIFVIAMAVIGILGLRNGSYYLTTGVLIGVVGLVMKIADAFILTEYSYADYKFVLRTVFTIYGEIGLSTVVLSILICVLTYSKSGR